MGNVDEVEVLVVVDNVQDHEVLGQGGHLDHQNLLLIPIQLPNNPLQLKVTLAELTPQQRRLEIKYTASCNLQPTPLSDPLHQALLMHKPPKPLTLATGHKRVIPSHRPGMAVPAAGVVLDQRLFPWLVEGGSYFKGPAGDGCVQGEVLVVGGREMGQG